MADERRDAAYYAWLEAALKFDYFVTGIAVALVGYLGGSLDAVRLGMNPETLEVAAIGAFLVAVVAGLRRIEDGVAALAATPDRISALSGATDAKRAKELQESFDKASRGARRAYFVRNISLLFGIVVLVVSRILPAYL